MPDADVAGLRDGIFTHMRMVGPREHQLLAAKAHDTQSLAAWSKQAPQAVQARRGACLAAEAARIRACRERSFGGNGTSRPLADGDADGGTGTSVAVMISGGVGEVAWAVGTVEKTAMARGPVDWTRAVTASRADAAAYVRSLDKQWSPPGRLMDAHTLLLVRWYRGAQCTGWLSFRPPGWSCAPCESSRGDAILGHANPLLPRCNALYLSPDGEQPEHEWVSSQRVIALLALQRVPDVQAADTKRSARHDDSHYYWPPEESELRCCAERGRSACGSASVVCVRHGAGHDATRREPSPSQHPTERLQAPRYAEATRMRSVPSVLTPERIRNMLLGLGVLVSSLCVCLTLGALAYRMRCRGSIQSGPMRCAGVVSPM